MTTIHLRESNELTNESEQSIPWQVRAIGFIGVPSAIAIYLIWWITSTLAPQLNSISTLLSEHQSTTVAVIEMIKTDRIHSGVTNDLLVKLLRSNCINNSNNAIERDRCNQ